MSESPSGSSRDEELPSPERIEALLERLHRTPPQFEEERLAPPVDRDLLRSLARRELSEAAARPVFRLILRFQSWRDAYKLLLVEEFHRSSQGSPPPPASLN
jgi:hypothetical protein